MGQGKQAKILTDAQVRAALAACDAHRYPLRDRVMVLLSVRAGLRATEIACLKWGDGDRRRGAGRRRAPPRQQVLQGT